MWVGGGRPHPYGLASTGRTDSFCWRGLSPSLAFWARTDRELKLIVRLGYVLGAFIGTVLVVVDALFR